MARPAAVKHKRAQRRVSAPWVPGIKPGMTLEFAARSQFQKKRREARGCLRGAVCADNGPASCPTNPSCAIDDPAIYTLPPDQGRPLPDRRRREPGRLRERGAVPARGRGRGHDPRQLLPGIGREHQAPLRRQAAQDRAGRRDAPAATHRGDEGRGRRPAPGRADDADHGPRPVDGSRCQYSRHAERDRGLLRQRREEAGVRLIDRRLWLRARHCRRPGRDHAVSLRRHAAGGRPLRRHQDHRRAALPHRLCQARARLCRGALRHGLRRAPALSGGQRALHHRDARPREPAASARA